MSSKTLPKTLDELLDEVGLTRDEWQRGRKLFEEMWRDVAVLNGWAPVIAARDQFRVSFPLRPNLWIKFTADNALTEDDFDHLIALLNLMRPGLLDEEPADG